MPAQYVTIEKARVLLGPDRPLARHTVLAMGLLNEIQIHRRGNRQLRVSVASIEQFRRRAAR